MQPMCHACYSRSRAAGAKRRHRQRQQQQPGSHRGRRGLDADQLGADAGQHRPQRHHAAIQEQRAHDAAAIFLFDVGLNQRVVRRHVDLLGGADGDQAPRRDSQNHGDNANTTSVAPKPVRPKNISRPVARGARWRPPTARRHRADARAGRQQAQAAAADFQHVAGEHGQHRHVRHAEDHRQQRQQHQRAQRGALPQVASARRPGRPACRGLLAPGAPGSASAPGRTAPPGSWRAFR